MELAPFDPDVPILVIDGSPIHRLELLRALDLFRFQNVTAASEGEEALRRARAEPYSLILLGNSLANGKSARLLSTIRSEGQNSATPILFTHTPEEVDAARSALSSGASALLPKPLDPETLRGLLSKHLEMQIATQEESAEENQRRREAAGPILERAKECFQAGNLGQARTFFEEGLRVGGESAEAYLGLAQVYGAMGDEENAEEWIHKAGLLDPAVRRMYYLKNEEARRMERGRRALQKKRFAQAESEFEKAIELNAENIEAHAGRAEALQALREPSSAREMIQKALALPPKADSVPSYNRIGLLSTRAKDYQMALQAYDRALSLEQNDAAIYYNKAIVRLLQKKFDEAFPLLEKALEINPKFTEAKLTCEKIQKWSKAPPAARPAAKKRSGPPPFPTAAFS